MWHVYLLELSNGDVCIGSTDDLRRRFRSHQQASASLPDLHAKGRLGEPMLVDLIEQGRFDHIVMALSLVCDLPAGLVERTMARGRREQVMLLAKAVGFSWKTALALIRFQACGESLSQGEIDRCFASYGRMQVATARTALQFFRLRERAATPEPDSRAQSRHVFRDSASVAEGSSPSLRDKRR